MKINHRKQNKYPKPKRISILILLSNLFIVLGLLYLLFILTPLILPEIEYQINRFRHVEYQVSSSSASIENNDTLDSLNILPPINIIPASTDFGLIIEKIYLNTIVYKDIGTANKSDYWNILNEGAAHAKGTVYPGQIGNSYIFAHSTIDPLNISKYNAVFTLINKLEIGDRIVTFFEGSRYDYFVSDKYIVDPKDITPITATYEEPVLTLQTCYPPGTDINRLIVIAKMQNLKTKLQ